MDMLGGAASGASSAAQSVADAGYVGAVGPEVAAANPLPTQNSFDFTKLLQSMSGQPAGGGGGGGGARQGGGGLDPLALFATPGQQQRQQDVTNGKGGSLDISQLVQAAAGFLLCWVATAVYKADLNKVHEFRKWVMTKAPTRFFNWYASRGPEYSEKLEHRPELVAKWRRFMDSKIG